MLRAILYIDPQSSDTYRLHLLCCRSSGNFLPVSSATSPAELYLCFLLPPLSLDPLPGRTSHLHYTNQTALCATSNTASFFQIRGCFVSNNLPLWKNLLSNIR